MTLPFPLRPRGPAAHPVLELVTEPEPMIDPLARAHFAVSASERALPSVSPVELRFVLEAQALRAAPVLQSIARLARLGRADRRCA
jgi:hypothetical protein